MSRWTDEDGRPLGDWVEIDRDEYIALMQAAGGTDALAVFATLTDPDGVYGAPQIYTAWGSPDDDAPLVDARDYVGSERRKVFRKFVRREVAALTEERNGRRDS